MGPLSMTRTQKMLADVSLADRSITRTGGKYLCGLLWCALAGHDQVSTGKLSSCLGVSRASVTEMVEKFGERDLVEYEPYRGSTLTADGEALARHLQWRRCVVQRFFEHDLALDVGDNRAYRIGFELPSEGVSRLAERVDHPCTEQCQATDASECPRLTVSPT